MLKIIRFTFALIYVALASLFGLLFCAFRPFAPENTLFLARMLSFGVLPITGAKVEIEGLENFDKIPGPAIILSNHQDNYDVFVIGDFVPYRVVSIGKKIIRYFPLFGQIYWLSGHILIDRKKKKKALGAMNLAGKKMIEKGIKVWIMPEGTRSRGRGLLPFKSGAFYLANQTKLPIIPISICNYAQHWNQNQWKKHTIQVKVHEPLVYKEENYPQVEELKNICYAIMKEGIAQMDQKAGYSVEKL